MSSVASLTSTPAAGTGTNSISDQIKALEKRISEGVKNGTISSQQGDALTKALDQVQQALDGGAAGSGSGSSATLSAADTRKISQMLRQIGRELSGAGQSQSSQAQSGMDSDGDYDNSGVSTMA